MCKLGTALSRYTREKSGTYDAEFDAEIRKIRAEWFINTADENKKKLLEMAKNGEDRPVASKHPLGKVLVEYTRGGGFCTDPVFTKEIEKIRPDWFISQAEKNKIILINLAEKGDPKPLGSWGKNLTRYTAKTDINYDSAFTEEIKKIRPDWFLTSAYNKKLLLLDMAKNGAAKPKCPSSLGKKLSSYINERGNYDSIFAEKLKKLRPDWFLDGTKENKEKLIAIARNREDKPTNNKDYLATALRNYIYGPNKDISFTEEIGKIRPDWLKKPSLIKKEKLLALAKEGRPKPSQATSLGAALSAYIRIGCELFDPKFTEAIKNLRPDWMYRKSTYGCMKKKEELLQMAKKGEAKPPKKHRLWATLVVSLRVSDCKYDKDFADKIKKLRPEWLPK